MELLKYFLVFVLLTTALAKPAGLWQDADISDADLHQGWMKVFMDSSHIALSSSSESQSSEEKSSEETLLTAAPPTEQTPASTAIPVAITTAGTVLLSTDLPIVDNATVPGQSTATPCVSTGWVTEAPVTDNRGDN